MAKKLQWKLSINTWKNDYVWVPFINSNTCTLHAQIYTNNCICWWCLLELSKKTMVWTNIHQSSFKWGYYFCIIPMTCVQSHTLTRPTLLIHVHAWVAGMWEAFIAKIDKQLQCVAWSCIRLHYLFWPESERGEMCMQWICKKYTCNARYL